MTSPNRNPYTFDNRGSLYDFLRGSNSSIRPTNGTLRLKPLPLKPPPVPEITTIQRDLYPISVPPPNPNYVWVTNRDTLSGNWFPTNSPIRQEDIGPTTFSTIGSDQTYQPQHHGIGTSVESAMTDEQLSNQLRNWNLPAEGNRRELFERNVRARLHPTFMQNMAAGRQPNEAELADITGAQNISLQEAARIRELRQQTAQPQTISSPAQLNNAQPQAPLVGGTMRLGDQAPISTSTIGGLPSQVQSVTQNSNLSESISPQSNTLETGGAAMAEEAGAMGGMEMLASRALPMLNMVFMGKMLADGLTSGAKEKKMQQQALMYRT